MTQRCGIWLPRFRCLLARGSTLQPSCFHTASKKWTDFLLVLCLCCVGASTVTSAAMAVFYVAMAVLSGAGRPKMVAVSFVVGAWLVCIPLAFVLTDVVHEVRARIGACDSTDAREQC